MKRPDGQYVKLLGSTTCKERAPLNPRCFGERPHLHTADAALGTGSDAIQVPEFARLRQSKGAASRCPFLGIRDHAVRGSSSLSRVIGKSRMRRPVA
jgi:hypothetical protein